MASWKEGIEYLIKKEVLSTVLGDSNNESTLDQANDLLVILREQEKSTQPYAGNSPQLHLRPEIISWMLEIAEEEHFLRRTMFMATYLFDRFSDAHDISVHQIRLVALSCLNIAAKFEQQESITPKMKYLKQFLPKNSDYSAHLFVEIEKYILLHFAWKLTTPTVLHFLDIFLLFSVDPKDIPSSDRNNNCDPLQCSNSVSDAEFNQAFIRQSSEIAKQVLNIQDKLLLVTPTNEYRTSEIAAASLMCARQRYGLGSWTEILVAATGYEEHQLEDCANYIKAALQYRV